MTTLYTIGHSNHLLSDFLELLEIHEIQQLIDIRAIPKSRLFPWFNSSALKKKLNAIQISYHHLPELGGRRHTNKNSINLGWHNTSFRGFADYMQTPAFFNGLKQLLTYVKEYPKTAIMCAEAVPWHCHRSLVADALIARHIKVLDIINKSNAKEHKLTPFAVINRDHRPIKIYYPDPNLSLDLKSR